MINSEILMQAVMESRDGISISDASLPDCPLIYVNPAFEKMTGYTREEVLNQNCRCLQGEDTQQRGVTQLSQAIKKGEYCLVTLRNYRKDGTMFWNELSISPVLNSLNEITHFIGIQKDVTARVILEQHLNEERKLLEKSNTILEKLVVHDTLTGLFNRRYFEDQLDKNWKHLMTTQGNFVVIFIDIDYFKRYNDTYGHIEGDEALKRVANELKRLLKRTSDFVARYGGEEFIALATDMNEEQAMTHAETICQDVRNLNIPHLASPHRFLTVSCGVAVAKPSIDSSPEKIIHQADMALYQAKAAGRNKALKVDI